MRSDRGSAAPLSLKLAAGAGLAFLHLPILLIFVYAFTTEEKSFSGRRRALPSNGSRSPGTGRISGTPSGFQCGWPQSRRW